MTAGNPMDAHVSRLSRAAEKALQDGQFDNSARLWEQVLNIAPGHSQALLRLGQHRLFQGDAKGAIQLLQGAAAVTPGDVNVHLNLAFAYQQTDDREAEGKAINKALEADPYCYPALLLRGALFERQGMRRAAARTYKDALSIAPGEGQLPAQFTKRVEHARTVVRENATELESYLEGKLDDLRRKYGAKALRRFEQCKDIVTGRRRIYPSQPTMLSFPELPAIQFLDKEQFSWVPELEARTSEIQSELVAVLEGAGPELTPYVRHAPGVPLNQWAALNYSPQWSSYFLWEDGGRIDAHCDACPATSALTESLPLCYIPGFAPAVFFSILAPGAHIPAHTGVTNLRLILHLPLIVPKGCRFRVGNEEREWRTGEAWIFDDTIEHEAWNESGEPRGLLIFDIWNPLLSEAEREMAAQLLIDLRTYYAS